MEVSTELNSADSNESPQIVKLDSVIAESKANLEAAQDAAAPKKKPGWPKGKPRRSSRRSFDTNAAPVATDAVIAPSGTLEPPFMPAPAGLIQPIESALEMPVVWMRTRFDSKDLELEGKHDLAVQADGIFGALLPEVANTKWGAITALSLSLAFAYGGLYLAAKSEFDRKAGERAVEEAKSPESPLLGFPTIQGV